MPFDIIVGMHVNNRAIGSGGKIPWKCRADMKFFKDTTTTTKDPTKTNAVIMGRKTFESLPAPLLNRVNVILTSTSPNFDETISNLEQQPDIETIFVIGGEMVYRQAICHPKCNKIYVNCIHMDCDLSNADTFFPEIDPDVYTMVECKVIDPCVTSYLYSKKRKPMVSF